MFASPCASHHAHRVPAVVLNKHIYYSQIDMIFPIFIHEEYRNKFRVLFSSLFLAWRQSIRVRNFTFTEQPLAENGSFVTITNDYVTSDMVIRVLYNLLYRPQI